MWQSSQWNQTEYFYIHNTYDIQQQCTCTFEVKEKKTASLNKKHSLRVYSIFKTLTIKILCYVQCVLECLYWDHGFSSFRYHNCPCPRCCWTWELTLLWYRYCKHRSDKSVVNCSTWRRSSNYPGSSWTWCRKRLDWRNCWHRTWGGRPFASAWESRNVSRWWL